MVEVSWNNTVERRRPSEDKKLGERAGRLEGAEDTQRHWQLALAGVKGVCERGGGGEAQPPA